MFNKLFGRANRERPDADALALAERNWLEFRSSFKQAFSNIQEAGSLETPELFSPGADKLFEQQTLAQQRLFADAKTCLATADKRLQALLAAWPDKQKALSKLRSSLVSYGAMVNSMDRLRALTSLGAREPDPWALRTAVEQMRRNDAEAQLLLAEGLSKLGRTLSLDQP